MIISYKHHSPTIGHECFVAPNATLIGSVVLGNRSSVWFNAVLRGDVERIKIGADSNLQDNVVVHADPGRPVTVGVGVTVGHAAVLHGCTIEDGALIGIGAIVLDGAVIGHHSLIGAGALVAPGKHIPPRSLVMGTPGKVIRPLTDEEVKSLSSGALEYLHLAHDFNEQLMR